MPKIRPMVLSLDSETQGLDLYHGARPFLVTFCDEQDRNTWFEWPVDPLTRKVLPVQEDLLEIQRLITRADTLVLQNPSFDYTGLRLLYRDEGLELEWDWSKVQDTLRGGHLLASNQPHNLTTMVLVYLGINIEPYEARMKRAVAEAKALANQRFPEWRLAKKGLPEMPSAKEKVWKFDCWLPRLVAEKVGYPEDHPWWTVTSEYANVDSASTLALWRKQREVIRERGLEKIYQATMGVPRIVCEIEDRGVTVNRPRLEELETRFAGESKEAGELCRGIAASYDYDLTLPKSGNNKSLTGFVFGPLGLESGKWTPKGAPSLDKLVLEDWEATLPERSKQLAFVQALRGKRKRDTALQYMEGYRRFWLPLSGKGYPDYLPRDKWGNPNGWFLLHPNLNPTGTNTLRWSSSSPNEQNISKQEGFNLRYTFGPAPGREWWSLDAANLELRIPAYEADEREMVALFERPDDPPYFGSYHLLVFDTLHPEKFAKHGKESKDYYAATWYQWTKNGNFAVQYGAVEQSGTADRAYHVPGAQRRIQSRFRRIKQLNERMIEQAERRGYVETIPDASVDPSRGYPLYCTRTNWGRVLPTVPLNYHVQGTACWWMMMGMIRIQKYLGELNSQKGSKGYYVVLNVHDELVFDFPLVKDQGNLPKIRKIQRLMEQSGEGIGVPTPVSIQYHPDDWSEGIRV